MTYAWAAIESNQQGSALRRSVEEIGLRDPSAEREDDVVRRQPSRSHSTHLGLSATASTGMRRV